MLIMQAQRASGQTLTAELQQFRDIYRELVEINTTDSVGDTTQAAKAMAERFRAAGFAESDIHIIVPPGAPQKGNLIVRYRGTGSMKPILLLAHLDVVEAKREDWERDPFKLIEEGGYFYGRGSVDDKAMGASFVATLIRYKKEGYRPDRDIILALTADEELASVSKWNGVRWIVDHHRSLIESEFALNEGGIGLLKNGKPLLNNVQAAEKVLVNFRLEVKNTGGHSALPRKDNAIYELADGLTRLAKFDFPVRLNEITKGFFSRSSLTESGQLAWDMLAVTGDVPDRQAVERLAKSPHYNAIMRTTCVATRLEGGHANNALPQTARALVNCRMLPGESVDEVQQLIAQAVGDKVRVTRASNPQPSPPSPLRADIMQAIEKHTGEYWTGIPVVPVMGTGATDARTLRAVGIHVYGVSGLFIDVDDYRGHGLNERVLVKSLYDMHQFLYSLVKTLSGGKQ